MFVVAVEVKYELLDLLVEAVLVEFCKVDKVLLVFVDKDLIALGDELAAQIA